MSAPEPPGDPSMPKKASGPDLAGELLARARADLRRGAAAVRRPARRRQVPGQVSGARPDERDPQLLGSVVDRFVTDRGWQTQRAVGGVEGRWEQIVGAELAAHCCPETFTDGALTVRAETTAWATQVRLLATTLLARLNDDLGAGTVTSLRVVGPDTPSWKKGRWSVQGRGPRDTYG